jgi:hypothetical protein
VLVPQHFRSHILGVQHQGSTLGLGLQPLALDRCQALVLATPVSLLRPPLELPQNDRQQTLDLRPLGMHIRPRFADARATARFPQRPAASETRLPDAVQSSRSSSNPVSSVLSADAPEPCSPARLGMR